MIKSFGWLGVAACVLYAPPARTQTLAQFHTPVGDALVELYDADKPATVRNFLRYVGSEAYRDMFLHRWEFGFVVQGGGFFTSNRFTANAVLDALPVFDAVTNEYSVGRTFSNVYGTLAMARVGGKTNSATSQWYFNLGDNSALDQMDGGFTVFGRVVLGTNLLEKFRVPNTSNGIYRLNLGGVYSTLPVHVNDVTQPVTTEDLLYVNISLPAPPRLSLAPAGSGAWTITWTSVSNFVNRVEYSSSLPPVWQTLTATNGNGATLEVADPSAAERQRYYRLRLE